MLPQRLSGSTTAFRSGAPVQVALETIRRRILAKLEERMDLGSSKRMPQSLLRQSLRQHAEQVVELEARGLPKADRDRLVDEAIAELFGYGPLDELFADPAVREVMVTGPNVVIVRGEHGQWEPSSVKFRDETHVRATLDRIATHAEPVGPVLASVTLFDMRLPNGFRALAVIPPEALCKPATVSFVRETTVPLPAQKDGSTAHPNLPATSSTSVGTLKTVPGSVTASPRPGSGMVPPPQPRSNSGEQATGINDPLARHRARILERLLTKFAAVKVYDVSRLDPNELRKIISAYIREYTETDKVYLSEPDQGRMTLEILTALTR